MQRRDVCSIPGDLEDEASYDGGGKDGSRVRVLANLGEIKSNDCWRRAPVSGADARYVPAQPKPLEEERKHRENRRRQSGRGLGLGAVSFKGRERADNEGGGDILAGAGGI